MLLLTTLVVKHKSSRFPKGPVFIGTECQESLGGGSKAALLPGMAALRRWENKLASQHRSPDGQKVVDESKGCDVK
jgi:hypothetical protein